MLRDVVTNDNTVSDAWAKARKAPMPSDNYDEAMHAQLLMNGLIKLQKTTALARLSLGV
jgi:hypothetical protein